MRKLIQLILGISLVIFSSGCLSTMNNSKETEQQQASSDAPTVTTTPEAELPKGYLAMQENELIYLNWTASDKNLTGQVSHIWVKEDKENQQEMANESLQFTGIMDKSNVSLNIYNSVTWTGMLENHTLTLAIPAKNGMISTYVFKPASIQNYNDAVTDLRDRVVTVNTDRLYEKKRQEEQQAQQNKTESQNSAVISYDQKLGHNIALLTESIRNGTVLVKYDPILSSYKKHWNNMLAHYQKQQANSNKNPLTSDDIYQASNDLYDMSNDNYDISNDKYDFDNVTNTVNQYISSLKDGIQYTQAQWRNLQNALANNPNGTAKASYTIEEVETILKQAQDEINKVTAIVNAKSSMASSYEKKADDLYDKASDYQATLIS